MHIRIVHKLGAFKPTVEWGSEVFAYSLYSDNAEAVCSLQWLVMALDSS